MTIALAQLAVTLAVGSDFNVSQVTEGAGDKQRSFTGKGVSAISPVLERLFPVHVLLQLFV